MQLPCKRYPISFETGNPSRAAAPIPGVAPFWLFQCGGDFGSAVRPAMDTDDHGRSAPEAAWTRLQSILGERGDERVRVIGLFVFFFLVIAAFWVQKPIRTSRFLTDVGPRYLPWVKLGTASLILPVVMLYSALAARHRREHMVYLCAGAFAASSLVFWWLFTTSVPTWTHYAYFFYVDIFNSVMVGLFWSFANDVTSPEQARRAYGFVGAGGILGGVFGSSLTGWTVERVGAADLLLVCAGFLLAIAWIARIVARHSDPAPAAAQGKTSPSWGDAVAGARLTLRSRYLTYIALVVGLYEIVSNVIDFQFNTLVAARYADEAAMAAFLGRFASASIVASLVAQLALTTWILRKWGPRVGLLVLPLVLGLGSAAFLALPLLTVVAAAFFADGALNYSLNQTAKEVLYTPTDELTKYQAKAFIDMFLMRLAKGVGSVLILVGVAWGSLQGRSVRQLGWLSLAVAIVWLIVAQAAGRRFAERTQPEAAGAPGCAGPPPALPGSTPLSAQSHARVVGRLRRH